MKKQLKCTIPKSREGKANKELWEEMKLLLDGLENTEVQETYNKFEKAL